MKRGTMTAFEDLAMKGLKAMSEYLTNKGAGADKLLPQAKVGCVAVGTYGRLSAARTNRMAVRLQAGKGCYFTCLD